MSNSVVPWVRSRGLGRLLVQETNVSDLIQFLSDRDPSPWVNFVGFIPDDVIREATFANHADLLLTSESKTAVVDVKLGHLMTVQQQEKYEALASHPDLYLAALSADEVRLESDSRRWRFLSLSDLVGDWEEVSDELARLLASEAAGALRRWRWDQMISGVFNIRSAEGWTPLSALNQKFLARVVTRRVAQDLRARGRLAWASVTSGGGLPLVQGWTPVRGEGNDRTFIAETRWWEAKPGGELRFGVDFGPRPGQTEDEEVRRADYEPARSMEADIDYAGLKGQVAGNRPILLSCCGERSRVVPRPKRLGGRDCARVHGFAPAGRATEQSPAHFTSLPR